MHCINIKWEPRPIIINEYFYKNTILNKILLGRHSVNTTTALVTARNSLAHERVIRTFRHWGVKIDKAFFMGGAPKEEVLKVFGADIFFDDQEIHLSHEVPSARVPYVKRVVRNRISCTGVLDVKGV